MDIQEQHHGAVVVLRPAGSLVEVDADSFRERALAAANKNLGRIVLDAEAIAFVDSRGIEALVDVTEHLGNAGRALKLCGMNATLKQVLELTGCASSFEFYEDAGSAVRSFL